MTPADVIAIAAQLSGFAPEQLTGPRRYRPLTGWRHATIAACSELTGYSQPAIARAFDRDHTTILNSLRRARTDPHLAALAERICAGAAGDRRAHLHLIQGGAA